MKTKQNNLRSFSELRDKTFLTKLWHLEVFFQIDDLSYKIQIYQLTPREKYRWYWKFKRRIFAKNNCVRGVLAESKRGNSSSTGLKLDHVRQSYRSKAARPSTSSASLPFRFMGAGFVKH